MSYENIIENIVQNGDKLTIFDPYTGIMYINYDSLLFLMGSLFYIEDTYFKTLLDSVNDLEQNEFEKRSDWIKRKKEAKDEVGEMILNKMSDICGINIKDGGKFITSAFIDTSYFVYNPDLERMILKTDGKSIYCNKYPNF